MRLCLECVLRWKVGGCGVILISGPLVGCWCYLGVLCVKEVFVMVGKVVLT